MANRIETTLPAVNGNLDFAVLTGKSDSFPYENGKRTSENRDGVKLSISLQGSRLATIMVKFANDPLPEVSDAQIQSATESCKFMYVQIPDAAITLYSAERGIGMSARAKTARIVTIGVK